MRASIIAPIREDEPMRLWRITAVVVALLGVAVFLADADAQQCPKRKLRLYTSWPVQRAFLVPCRVACLILPIPVVEIRCAVGAMWAMLSGFKKVYFVNGQQLFGERIVVIFEATAKKIGLPVVANEGIDWKQPDQKPVLTKVRASGADLVYLGGVIETGAQVIIRQMKEVGLVAPRTRFMGPDGLLEEELLKGATCDAALATDMRVTFAGLPFEKMRGVGAKTYETYKTKYGKEPTSYALYAAEGGRVIIDAIKRAAPAIEKAKDVTEKREAVRKAIAST